MYFAINPSSAISDPTSFLEQLLRPGRRISAKVLRVYDEQRVLVRMGGLDLELRTQTPLRPQQRLFLRVVGYDGESLRLELVDRMVRYSGVLAIRELKQLKRALLKVVHEEEVQKELALVAAKFRAMIETMAKHHPQKAVAIGRLMLDAERLDADSLRKAFELLSRSERLHRELRHLAKGAHLDLVRSIEDFLTTLQIYWIMGAITGSMVTYLPIAWEGLEYGHLQIKSLENRRIYYCKIALRFEDVERVDVTLLLHRHYLAIYFAVEDEFFRETIQEELPQLRARFSDAKVAVNIFVNGYNAKQQWLHAEDSLVDRRV